MGGKTFYNEHVRFVQGTLSEKRIGTPEKLSGDTKQKQGKITRDMPVNVEITPSSQCDLTNPMLDMASRIDGYTGSFMIKMKNNNQQKSPKGEKLVEGSKINVAGKVALTPIQMTETPNGVSVDNP